MNLQIVSDSVNRVGMKNYTNDFTMSLSEPIDAENNDVYLRVLNVSYPLTIKTVLDDCWFKVEYTFKGFKGSANPAEVIFSTGKINLPDGIYTMKTLVDTLNSYVEEYDIIISQTREGKIGVHFNFNIQYWFQQFKSTDGLAYNGGSLNSFQSGHTVLPLNVSFAYSPKLQYMLGLEQVDFNEKYTAYWGKNLPDIMDGVNKIFIYCDQIDASIVGDSKSRLLAVVPIELDGQGSGELFTYSPAKHVKKADKIKD
jgi:hypothetical protein